MDVNLSAPATLFEGDTEVATGGLLSLLRKTLEWDEAQFERAHIRLLPAGPDLGPRDIETINAEQSVEDM